MSQDLTAQHMQIRAGDIRPGQNPRTYFPEDEQHELEESIRATGIIQLPVVRPVEGGFEMVAGERRWRAFVTVFGADAMMDVIVRQLSDEQAETVAIIENVTRTDMSPTEEAASAHRLLMRLRDKHEVAAELSWPLSKLERRLALMRCSPLVRQHLTERKILLGHAELLAALAEDKQDQAVEMVIENNLSVQDLRRSLSNIAQKLEEAIFDKSDCLNCHHNSTCQAALFSESIGDGSCTHPTCFRDKTNDYLDKVKAQLEREVNKVEFLEPGDEQIIPIKIVAEGAKGVGSEQLTACKGCANCGATISKMPDDIGRIEKEICFDLTCHTAKVAENLKAIAAQAAEPTQAPSGSPKQTKLSQPAATKTAKAGEIRAPLKEYAEKFLRRVAAGEVVRDQEMAEKVFIWLALTGQTRYVSSTLYAKAYASATEADPAVVDLEGVVSTLSDIDEQKRRRLVACAAGYTMMDSAFPFNHVKNILKMLKVDLSLKWQVNADFLNLLTKAEIEAFLQLCGLEAHIGTDALKQLLNNKKDEVIKGILSYADTFLAGKLHPAISYAN